MKRLLPLALALCLLLTLAACRDSDARKAMRRQMDLYYGKIQPDLPEYPALENGVTLSPKTLWDKYGFTVEALGILEDSSYYQIPLTLKNSTGHDLTWAVVGDGSINGFAVTPHLSGDQSVCDKGMAVATLEFTRDALPLVVTPGTITATLSVRDGSDGISRKVELNLQTSAGEGENKAPLADTPCWSNDDVSLTLLDAEEDQITWSFTFLVENRSFSGYFFQLATDQPILLNAQEIPGVTGWCFGIGEGREQGTLILRITNLENLDAGVLGGRALESLDFTLQVSRILRHDDPELVPIHIDLPR